MVIFIYSWSNHQPMIRVKSERFLLILFAYNLMFGRPKMMSQNKQKNSF